MKTLREIETPPGSRSIHRGVRRRFGAALTVLAAFAIAPSALATAYTVDTTSDSTAGDGSISLREAIEAANTNAAVGDAPAGSPGLDTIDFAPALDGATVTLGGSALTVSEALDISDPNATPVVVSAANGSQVLVVTGGPVSISDITLADGSNAGPGGAIHVGPGVVLRLDGVRISGSTANNGGGIYNDGGTLTVDNSAIDGNVANGTPGSGGGIFVNTGGTLVATNTEITNNRADRAGGGIEDNSGAGLGITLNNVTLDDNNAGVAPATAAPGNGGGLHITGPGDADITGGSASNNVAAQEGGGLWNGGGTMTVDGTEVNSNTGNGPASHDGGGGIFNLGGTLIVTNATISGNDATGGSGSGGGILSIDGAVTVTYSTLAFNSARRAGGAIEIVDGTVSIDSSNMISNDVNGTAGPTAPGNGGAFHISGMSSTVTVDGGTVFGNEAAREGGGLWNQSGTTMIIQNGTLIQGNAGHGSDAPNRGGGGLFNSGGIMIVSNATITENIADGAAGSGGGVLNNTGGSLTVSDSEISNNRANRAGGGIEDTSGAGLGLTLTNVKLDGNNAGVAPATAAPGNGGGLHISGPGDAMITGGTANSNVASREGGGLWNSVGILTVDGTEINSNTGNGPAAHDGGGGIFNNGGTLIVSNATISGNDAIGASGSGGGVLSTAGAVTFTNSTLSFNSANRAGGAFEIVVGDVTLTDTNMIGNDVNGTAGTPAPGNGGAFHITGAGTVLVDGGAVFGNEAAREGGGLWNQAGTTMTIQNGTAITSNEAHGPAIHDGGGGLFNSGGDLIVNGALINDNIADGSGASGGGVFGNGGTVAIDGSMIGGNGASTPGSGVGQLDGSTTITSTTVMNSVAGYGTAVVAGDAVITGSLTANDSSTISPGLSPAIIASGNLRFSSLSTFAVELDGASPAAGSGHDQIDVSGIVRLNSATLALDTSELTSVTGTDRFVIINNDGTEEVRGTFDGLPEGSIISLGGTPVQITYRGGTGNDVVLGDLPPVILGAKDMILTVPEGGTGFADFSGISATDGIDGSLPVTCSPDGSMAFPVGSTTVTCMATDSGGNTTTEMFQVIVVEIQNTEAERFLDVVSLRGDAVPGAGTNGIPADATYFFHNNASLNNSGEVIIGATIKGTGYTGSAVIFDDMLLANTSAAAPGGGTYGAFRDLVVDDASGVGFRSQTSTGAAHLVGSPVMEAARVGGMTPGGEVYSLLHLAALDGNGNLLTPANLQRTSGVTASDDSGIWSSDGSVVAREGGAAGAPGVSYGQVLPRVVADVAGNNVAFAAILSESPLNPLNNSAIFTGPAAAPVIAIREGDLAPGTGGATFQAFLGEAVNSNGDFVFRATLRNGIGVSSTTNEGIWAMVNGTLSLVAREGDVAACQPDPDVQYSRFSTISIDDSGTICLFSFLRGPSISSANDGSVWRRSPDGETLLLVQEGDLAVNTDGSAIAQINGFTTNNVGGVIYSARLVAGIGDTTTSNNQGIWLDRGPVDSIPQIVLRRGDTFDLTTGDERTVVGVGFDARSNSGGGTGGYARSLSDDGDVLLKLSVSGASSGVFMFGMENLAAPQETPAAELVDDIAEDPAPVRKKGDGQKLARVKK